MAGNMADRIAEHARNHFHSLNEAQVEHLTEVFARLTPHGWDVPEWLILLGVTVRPPEARRRAAWP